MNGFYIEAEDEIDEVEHRPPTEEYLFYQAVTNGDVEAVKKKTNVCRRGREEAAPFDVSGILSIAELANLEIQIGKFFDSCHRTFTT